MAAVDYFLKIDGIEGEAEDAKHGKEIELHSWSWGEQQMGTPEVTGEMHFRDMLGRTTRGVPAVEISSRARWTLRALAGGYTRAMVRGRLQDYAEEGPYRTLMEGLESFMGLVRSGAGEDKEDDENQNYSVDRWGNRYVSAIPARHR